MKAELEYITSFEGLYPGIDLWFKSKVIGNVSKSLHIVKHNYTVCGMSILDLHQGKICHFSIHKDYRFLSQRTYIKDYLYKSSIEELKHIGFSEIFAHGTEGIVNAFIRSFKGWNIYQEIGNFGRNENDFIIKKNI